MNEFIARLKMIVDSFPSRDKRGDSEGEIEEFYNSIEAAEDAFMDVVDEISPNDLCRNRDFLDMICRLAIEADSVYIDGEDKSYSNYQERLPFRLYDRLEWWTIEQPKLLTDEIKRHLPNIRL